MNKARARSVATQNTKRLFLVDDHPMIRHSLNQMLSQQDGLVVVGEAGGAIEAMSGIAQTNPQLVITDLTLAEGDGLDLIKNIRSQWPEIKILVASMHGDPTYAERAMRAGALGYITKDQPPNEIAEAVRTVLRKRIYVSPDLSNALMSRALQNDDGLAKSPIDALSDRELQVFELLGDGKSTREIAEKLSLSIKTIETYRDNIKQKLSLKNSNELTHRAVCWKLDQGIK